MKTVGVVFIVLALAIMYLLLSGKLQKVMGVLSTPGGLSSKEEQHIIHVWGAYAMLFVLALMLAPMPKIGGAFMLIVAGVAVNMLIDHAKTQTSPTQDKAG